MVIPANSLPRTRYGAGIQGGEAGWYTPGRGETMKKVGLIVNPIAGMGGRVGLKGTDGEAALARARQLGAPQEAPARTVEALKVLASAAGEVRILTCPAGMGEHEARAAGLSPTVVVDLAAASTTAGDTRTAAREMARQGVDLLLFAGGDGTARDILDAIGDTTTSLGIPAGVKVHSAVFGATPRDAGRAVLAFLRDGLGATRMAEVMDIDEDAARRGTAAARLYGYLRVPDDNTRLQAAKDGGVESGDRAVRNLAAAVAAKMEPGVTYIMGPGSTIAAVMDELGLDGTLLGVDVVRDRQVVASDAGERQLLDLVQGRDARIVVTVIGGQGHILGRGNQQISPQVVRAAGPANIIVAATTDKLASIQGRPLLVDTGDPALDSDLAGYTRVITGPGQYAMLRIAG